MADTKRNKSPKQEQKEAVTRQELNQNTDRAVEGDELRLTEMDRDTKRQSRYPSTADPKSVKAGFELSDLSVRGFILYGVGLIIFVAVSNALITGLQSAYLQSAPNISAPSTNPGVPEEAEPAVDNAPVGMVPADIPNRTISGLEQRQLRAEEEQILGSYGWVDQGAGVVHIPIDRAIELLAERGMPTRPEAESSEFRDNGAQLPLDSSSGWRYELNPRGENQ